jgi:hypothetical protein
MAVGKGLEKLNASHIDFKGNCLYTCHGGNLIALVVPESLVGKGGQTATYDSKKELIN